MTRLAFILFLIANCQLPIANAQFMPPTQVDTGWMAADITAPVQTIAPQPSVNIMRECYDYDYGYFTGLDISTNFVDWITIAGFPAQATNKVSLPRAKMMFFRRWLCETNRF